LKRRWVGLALMTEWLRVALGDLVSIKHGYAFKGEYFRNHPPGDILLTPGNFAIGGGFQLSKLKYYDGPPAAGFVLSPGDLLVTMTDLSKAGDTLGFPAIVPADGRRYLHNQRLGKVEIKSPRVSREFVYWLMRTATYRHEVLSGVTGSTVKHTSPSKICAFKFDLPPLEEQKSICDALNALDDKVELNRQMNVTLEAMAQAIFRDWFVDFGPVRRKRAGATDPVEIMGNLTPDPARAAELAALFPEVLGDDGLPEGWSNPSLSDHLEIIGGGTPKTSIAEYWDGTIPWFSVVDTPSGSDLFVFSTAKSVTAAGVAGSSARLIPEGTTIISARGTVGNLAIAAQEMTFNQSCYALQSTRGEHPCYVYLLAGHAVSQLRSMAHGSVFSTITRQTFDAMTFPSPPIKILDQLEAVLSPIFARIKAAGAENRTLAGTRDYLLPRLMSGAVRVGAKTRDDAKQ
jgi:type I restriction enzyme S subunit